MPIGQSGDGDATDENEGPHCRNCHVGSNNCDTCHNDASGYNVSSAYTATITASVTNMTNYSSQSYIRQSAVTSATIGAPCLDAGFSFPHRTLGANMLKDELFGIDFNGDAKPYGTSRTTNGGNLAAGDGDGTEWEYWVAENLSSGSIIPTVKNDNPALENRAVENMDSVCIDCHGDASYWQGDNPALHSEITTTAAEDKYGFGGVEGWELLLKGLP